MEINVLITLIRLPPTQTRDSNVALTATPSISTALHIFVPVLSILIELDLLICTLNKQKLSFVTKPYHVIHQISLNPIACLERHELKKQSVFRLSNIFLTFDHHRVECMFDLANNCYRKKTIGYWRVFIFHQIYHISTIYNKEMFLKY